MKKIYTFILALMISGLGFGQLKNQNHNSGSQTSNINKTIGATGEHWRTSTNLSESNSNDYTVESANELVFIKINANTNSNSYSTDIYFNDFASLGFDLGFDASFFGAIPDFVIYSELVEDNEGLPLALQAVGSSDLADVNIPLVINSNQGVELTVNIATSTLPPTAQVYLDDTVASTSTLLNNTDYVFTPAVELSGPGRFFLRILIPPVTYTFNGSWSPSDPNGVSNTVDHLEILSGDATINTNTNCNTLTVNPGASLTVDTGVTLTPTAGLSLESSSTSYSSLILDGTVAGTMTYDRHVNINGSGTTGSNDLVSAPLTGEVFNSFATANPNILNNGTLYLFGPFEKAAGTFVTWAGTETSTLDAGVGYRAATSDNSTVRFTGTAESGVVNNDIINGGTNNEDWNLIGNPYPSYMNVWAFLGQDTGGGFDNIDLMVPATAAIYGYDGSALNGWTVYNFATTLPSTVIAPGQGFFISARADRTASNDIVFDPSMRRTGNTDDFIAGRNAELTYVKLSATTDNDAFGTDIYFNNNASLGFDLGYDAALWDAETPEDFAIYSHLAEGNQGKAMALQAVNMSNLDDVVIPLGVNAKVGEAITFSILDMTLPASVKVYLEDTVENKITLLNDSDYVVTPTSDLSGTGRFFLRTSNDELSTIDGNLDNLDIFTLKASSELVINGELLNNNTMLNLYDIQGRLVLSTKLDEALIQNRIDVSNINSGVYIATVSNNSQEKTKKVIID